MKAPSILFTILAMVSCKEDKTDSANSDGGSNTPNNTSPPSSPNKEVEGRTITPSSRRNNVENAQIDSAKTCITRLTKACDGFYEEYQALPGSGISAVDTTLETDNFFMSSLLGLKFAEDENPKFITFFVFKSTTSADKKDGLLRTDNRAELFDPWGNRYNIVLNYDYDNQLKTTITDEIIWDCRVIAWSAGPDGQSGTPKTDADNVYSWNNK